MDANSEDNGTSVHSQTNYICKKEVHVMEKRSSCSGSPIGIHNTSDPYTTTCIHYSSDWVINNTVSHVTLKMEYTSRSDMSNLQKFEHCDIAYLFWDVPAKLFHIKNLLKV